MEKNVYGFEDDFAASTQGFSYKIINQKWNKAR